MRRMYHFSLTITDHDSFAILNSNDDRESSEYLYLTTFSAKVPFSQPIFTVIPYISAQRKVG